MESSPDLPATLELLTHGSLTVEGRLAQASNATLLATVALDGQEAVCVYKPVRGERPLWDFPDGTLAARERASYLVSEATGWSVVPPTVLRDGPFGQGMCQLWTDPDPAVTLIDITAPAHVPPGWLGVLEAVDEDGEPVVLAHADDPRLRRLAVLDLVINNADRKGGHVLALPDGRVLGVDHGVSFSVDDKLRTVLWGWAGRPLDAEAAEVLRGLRRDFGGSLGEQLRALLSAEEVRRTAERVDAVLHHGRFPAPGAGWPPIPWPPF